MNTKISIFKDSLTSLQYGKKNIIILAWNYHKVFPHLFQSVLLSGKRGAGGQLSKKEKRAGKGCPYILLILY